MGGGRGVEGLGGGWGGGWTDIIRNRVENEMGLFVCSCQLLLKRK